MADSHYQIVAVAELVPEDSLQTAQADGVAKIIMGKRDHRFLDDV